jgi:hypothetical protein
MAVSGMAHPQGGRRATVFYPFGRTTPYAFVCCDCDDLTMRNGMFIRRQNLCGNNTLLLFSPSLEALNSAGSTSSPVVLGGSGVATGHMHLYLHLRLHLRLRLHLHLHISFFVAVDND